MDNVIVFQIEDSLGEIVEHVSIKNGEHNYTVMLKSTYDEMIAQQEAIQPLL
jgi:hypothetical protein